MGWTSRLKGGGRAGQRGLGDCVVMETPGGKGGGKQSARWVWPKVQRSRSAETKKKPMDFSRRQLLMTSRGQWDPSQGGINGEKNKAASHLARECRGTGPWRTWEVLEVRFQSPATKPAVQGSESHQGVSPSVRMKVAFTPSCSLLSVQRGHVWTQPVASSKTLCGYKRANHPQSLPWVLIIDHQNRLEMWQELPERDRDKKWANAVGEHGARRLGPRGVGPDPQS